MSPPETDPPPAAAGRRRFLANVASTLAGSIALGACGGGDGPAPAIAPTPEPISPVPAPDHPLVAIMSAARDDNPFVNRPWSPAPPHAADTAYFRGGMVRGRGNDAHRVYQCVKLQGVSGPDSAPSGNGPAGLVDGSTAWLYWGSGRTESQVPLHSSVTPTGAGDMLDGFVAFPQAPPETLGLTRNYPLAFGAPPALVSGGNALLDNGGHVDVQGPITGNLTNMARASSARRHKLHFMTDCRQWLAVVQHGPLYPTGYCIEVDRRALTEGDLTQAALRNPGYLLLNMGLFGPGPHEVVIRKVDAVPGTAIALSVGPNESIWPAADNGFSVAFEGDSITQGGGIGSQSITYLLDTLIGAQLGASSTYNNAIGGTGLISNLQGARTTYLDRLADIARLQPTLLVHGGYHNDESFASLGLTRAQRVSAIANYLRAFRTACPQTTLFQLPVQTLQGEAMAPGSSLHDLELDVIEAFSRWGDRNAVLVPLLTAAEPFPATTEQGWHFLTSGSIAEFRVGHPVQRYYPDLAARVVAAIRTHFGVPA